MLELYHWEPTLDSGEPLICLQEKQLPFASRYVSLLRLEQHREEFLRLNPTGQVPVLVHDGRVISEAGLVMLYLEEAFPHRPLLPKSLAGQYQAHFWIKYVEERIAPYVTLLGWHGFTRGALPRERLEEARGGIGRLPRERRELWQKALDDTYSEEELALARESLAVATGRLERALERAPWLAGESYSLADIALLLAVRALRVVQPDLLSAEGAPRTLEWLARLEERPAVRETLALARVPAPERLFAPGPEPARWG